MWIDRMLYSCLAHIINLATQAFLAAYSKAKYYDPKDPDDHLQSDTDSTDARDVVGLVRVITVKVQHAFSLLIQSLTRIPGALICKT